MKDALIIAFVFAVTACHSDDEKKRPIAKPELDQQVLELVQFMQDSVSGCDQWLSKDYRIRKFFDDTDTTADYVERIFDHDDIIALYQGAESMTQTDYAPYLDSLKISFVNHVDSVDGCASALNTIAFIPEKQRALALFVSVEDSLVHTHTFLLQKLAANWTVIDTLRKNVHPRETY